MKTFKYAVSIKNRYAYCPNYKLLYGFFTLALARGLHIRKC